MNVATSGPRTEQDALRAGRTQPAEPAAWWDGPVAALDLEATGTDPRTARILEIGLVIDHPLTGPRTVVDTLVDPGPDVAIPPGASAINGITRERLESESAPPLAAVLRRVHGALRRYADENRCVVIYNATYDWPLLGAELARLDPPLALPDCLLVDPLVLDRHVDRYRRGKRTLARACEVYEVVLDDAHRAGADAIASCAVVRELARRHGDRLPGCPRELFDLQVEAHGEWLASYNRWRAGEGLPPVPEHAWPSRS